MKSDPLKINILGFGLRSFYLRRNFVFPYHSKKLKIIFFQTTPPPSPPLHLHHLPSSSIPFSFFLPSPLFSLSLPLSLHAGEGRVSLGRKKSCAARKDKTKTAVTIEAPFWLFSNFMLTGVSFTIGLIGLRKDMIKTILFIFIIIFFIK